MADDKRILFYESLGSTNDELKRLALLGAHDRTVVVAKRQDSGRGRMGRSFLSPEGGVYLSYLIKNKGYDKVSELTAWAAVACRRAIYKACNIKTDIKWVNDLQINGKKICGILCESVIIDGKVEYTVIGIGINLNTDISRFDDSVKDIATSVLWHSKKPTDWEDFVFELVSQLDELSDNWPEKKEGYLREYKENCITVGQRVCYIKDGKEIILDCIDIAEDFSLCAKTLSGEKMQLYYGEVSTNKNVL